MKPFRIVLGRRTLEVDPGTLGLAILLLLFLEYGLMFILRTSFVIEGTRWFSLFDDGMISMRYARNLAEGAGLVWNPGGEAVEGYTNFLWVLVMAALHFLPLPEQTMALSVQLVSLLLLAANVVLVYRLASEVTAGSRTVSLSAAALTAFYYSLNNWSLQGMEVGVLALLVTGSIGRLLAMKPGEKVPAGVVVASILIVLTRPDTLMLVAVLWGIHALGARSAGGRVDWRPALAVTAAILLHTIFRLWYYGDALPNTYYLKLHGVPLGLRLERGFSSLADFIGDAGLILFLLPLSLLLTAAPRRRAVIALSAPLIVQCAYSIAVGGDAWEGYGGANRYIAPVMPLMFVLTAWSITALLNSIAVNDRIRAGRTEWRLKPVLNILLVVYAFWSFNRVHWTSLLLVIPPLEVHNNEEMVHTALAIRETTTPEATVAVVWAGAIPYVSSRTAIDLLGKNDRRIAHLPVKHADQFVPGHDKWDYDISLRSEPPDVIAQVWREWEAITPFLEQEYRRVSFPHTAGIWYRNGSPRVLWGRVRDLER